MDALFVGGIVLMVSSVLLWLIRRAVPRPARFLWIAGRTLLEFVGLWTVCLVLDIVTGTAVLLVARTLAAVFMSVYVMTDLAFIVLAALQACVLHAWLTAPER